MTIKCCLTKCQLGHMVPNQTLNLQLIPNVYFQLQKTTRQPICKVNTSKQIKVEQSTHLLSGRTELRASHDTRRDVHTNQTNSSQNDFSCLPGANPNVPTSLRDLHQITNVRSNITKCTYHISRNRVDMSEPAFGKGVSYHSSTTPYHTPHTPCSLLSDTVLQSPTPVLLCTTKY